MSECDALEVVLIGNRRSW